jgi:hypothetical protein
VGVCNSPLGTYEVDAVQRLAIEGWVGMNHIAARTAGDLVRFAVLCKEGVVARPSVENVSTRTPVQDVITVITKLDDIANQPVVTPAACQGVVAAGTREIVSGIVALDGVARRSSLNPLDDDVRGEVDRVRARRYLGAVRAWDQIDRQGARRNLEDQPVLCSGTVAGDAVRSPVVVVDVVLVVAPSSVEVVVARSATQVVEGPKTAQGIVALLGLDVVGGARAGHLVVAGGAFA